MPRRLLTRLLTRLALAVVPALLLTVPLARTAGAQAKPDDAFAKAFFDPQLVLKHANAIGLTAQQRKAILDEMKATQVALVPLQVDMADPALELQGIIEASKVDEAKALAKIDQVLKIENEVKKRQATFVIRVKNLLTPEQQGKLRAIREGGGGEENDGADAPRALFPTT